MMNEFKILPVIDVLNSQAVHAVKGERSEYKLLKSHLFNTNDPVKILNDLNKKYHFEVFYVADLDAIMHGNPNYSIITELCNNSLLKICLDPGIKEFEDIQNFAEFKLEKLIIGLETLSSIEVLRESKKYLDSEQILLSIDMYDGKVLTRIESFKKLTPLEVIKELERNHINDIILLDLFRVGQKVGGIPREYLQIRESFKGNILVGGGIRNIQDVIAYKQEGFSGVLIGTALYDGSININELSRM